MKKLLFLLAFISILIIPISAQGEEVKYSADNTSNELKTEFSVLNTITMDREIYTGYKLGDYNITNLTSFEILTWSDPEYIIVEGSQDVEIKSVIDGKEVVFDAKINGKLRPLKTKIEEITETALIGSSVKDVFKDMAMLHGRNTIVHGTINIDDWDSSTIGLRTFNYTFIPDDPLYEIKTGTIKIKFIERPSEEVDIPTTPSLTATSVLLGNRTSYDINLNDKISGSTYSWSSNNEAVVKVNAKNGLLTAVSEGTAIITCVITTPEKSIQTLTTEITVGYDENAPLLTESVLDLNPGDTFDINLENKIAKSKYRWASSDRSIVTVNSANGIVTAKAPGTAYVTCTITTPNNQVIVLRADINVTEPGIVTE